MSVTVMSDAMMLPATESPTIATVTTTEIEFAKCECCGLTEECTPAYIETIRERYYGKWICGLCGEAVKDEIVRSERMITTEEAMARHMNFCRKCSPSSSPSPSSDPPPNPAVHLIAAMRQILRRSLDSPARSLTSSMPNSPLQNSDDVRFRRSESCCLNLTLDETSSYTELKGIEK